MHSIDSSLYDKAKLILKRALLNTIDRPRLTTLHLALKQSLDKLDQPMRVALVGKIKAGKSTLANALLGQDLVATGVRELTYNINWIKFGTHSSVKVHFKDASPPEERSREELEALTKRPEKLNVFLNRIKFIEVYYENEFLKSFELIDTPGLMSYYEIDERNTLEFLNLQPEDISDNTKEEASNADAVIYMFTKSIGQTDKDLVNEFQGSALGRATPINSIGVLTKVDDYWSQQADPIIDGGRIAQRLISESKVKNTFYNVYPVSGLVAFGAQTFTEDEYRILGRLSELQEEKFNRIIKDGRKFCKRDYDFVSVAPSERLRVWDRLGQYGCWLAYNLIKKEKINHGNELRQSLLVKSGIKSFQEVILSHFGNRALLIKLNAILFKLSSTCFALRKLENLDSNDLNSIMSINAAVEAIQKEHAFSEQKVLRDYYMGKLEFSTEEISQLLEVTGEYGVKSYERLGLQNAEDKSLEKLMQVARNKVSHWRSIANDMFLYSRDTIDAARIITRSYEQVLFQLTQSK